MRVIDLNADLGEGIGDDDALLRIVTSANIATGAHAGGGRVLRRAVQSAVAGGVSVGAHPSYRDRGGFGRASHLAALQAEAGARAALVRDLVDQILSVARAVERAGAPLTHVKAHGSLYNEAVAHPEPARVVLDAVHSIADRLGYPVAVMSQPHGHLAQLARAAGSPLVAEGFVDRGYEPTGQLVARGLHGDLHGSIAAMVAQALDLAAGRVRSVDGSTLDLVVGSMCVHGDTPDAVDVAVAVHSALLDAGWQVSAPWARIESPSPQVALVPGDAHPAPRIRALPFGDRAVLLEPLGHAGPATAWVLRIAARARAGWPGTEVVAGLASVLVVFDHPAARPPPAQMGARLAAGGGVHGGRSGSPGTRDHQIDVHYDGPDLADLAHALGVSARELAARHAGAHWTVAAVGFSPGFGYLTSSDPIFEAIARRADPRPRVPAGSLALAAGMCAVYPSESPGGWQLVGRTDTVLFDAGADRPALLEIGDVVSFREAAR